MNLENGPLIVCGVLTIVILFNIGLFFSFLRGRGQTMRESLPTLKNPWQEEDQAFADLHEKVNRLKKSKEPEEPQDDK